MFVSQSGETADTYAALDLCKKNGVKTCAVVNVIESSIARDSEFVLPIHCGTEIGVASTKAFLGQILILYILSLKLGFLRKDLKLDVFSQKLNDLKKLPKLVQKVGRLASFRWPGANALEIPRKMRPCIKSISTYSIK